MGRVRQTKTFVINSQAEQMADDDIMAGRGSDVKECLASCIYGVDTSVILWIDKNKKGLEVSVEYCVVQRRPS